MDAAVGLGFGGGLASEIAPICEGVWIGSKTNSGCSGGWVGERGSTTRVPWGPLACRRASTFGDSGPPSTKPMLRRELWGMSSRSPRCGGRGR